MKFVAQRCVSKPVYVQLLANDSDWFQPILKQQVIYNGLCDQLTSTIDLLLEQRLRGVYPPEESVRMV